MKRVISSTIEGELRSMYSLIGETFRNDGKELKEAISPYISPGTFSGGDNFVFHADSKTGVPIRILTEPTDDTQGHIEVVDILGSAYENSITAASDTEDDSLDDSISNLKDNFDYILSGVELLARSGNSGIASDIVSEVSDSLDSFISKIAEYL